MTKMNELERQNQEANYFACCLLMPEQLIREDFGQDPFDILDDARVPKLAKRYGVSEQMMLWRLTQLGLIYQ